MKSVLSYTCKNRVIELVLGENPKSSDRKVVASMTLFEGLGAWVLVDLRLARHRMPSPYSGGLPAEAIHAHVQPESDAEARLVRSLLREYWEDEDGIHWCTFDGLVRGPRRLDSHVDEALRQVGFFSRKEGLAYLKEVQLWWAAFEGELRAARLANPNAQASEMQVSAALHMHRVREKALREGGLGNQARTPSE